MSHFTVLVIGENPEEQLIPYQENNMGDCPPEYMEFNSVDEECKKEYNDGKVEVVKLPNGELVSPYDDMFKVRNKEIPFSYDRVIPENYIKMEVPFKERYHTFEEFMEEYHGYKFDEACGSYGYWYNPNAKWDWYQLGGRWTGFFRLKSGKTGQQGSPGLMTDPAKPNYADQAIKEDIDVETMRADARMKALDNYLKFEAILNGRPMPPRWSEIRDKYPDEIEKAREEYHVHPVMKDLREANIYYFGEDIVDIYGCGKEEFLNRAERNVLSTFAIIKDGEWYEKGSMGWWGMVLDEKNEDAWLKEFRSLYDSLPVNTLLSIFDCHI